MFVSLCEIVGVCVSASASRLSASRLGVPNWRPSASRIGVPNWRPELGPFQPVPNWGVQRVPNELFIKVQVWGVGVGGGVFQRVPSWGGSKTGYSSASRMGPFSLATHPEGSGKIGFWRIVGILGRGRVQIWQFLAIFSNLGDFASPGIPGNGGGLDQLQQLTAPSFGLFEKYTNIIFSNIN